MSERVLVVGGENALFELIDGIQFDAAHLTLYATENHEEALRAIEVALPDILITDASGLAVLEVIQENGSNIATLLIEHSFTPDTAHSAISLGIVDYLTYPLDKELLTQALEKVLGHSADLRRLETLKVTSTIGDMLAARSDLDDILDYVMRSAARLASAEEATLMLLNEETQQLYIRAAANLDDDPATINALVDDKMAMHVVMTGQALFINARPGQHVKTRYMVNNLMYTPLIYDGGVMGVLGVHNRVENQAISRNRLEVLDVLANYAAIAVTKQREAISTRSDTNVMSTVLEQIPVPILVIDDRNRVVAYNRESKPLLDLGGKMDPVGYYLADVTTHEPLIDLFYRARYANGVQGELALDDNRIYQVHISLVEGIGYVAVLSDITRLRNLYQSKGELISSLSHDLRSPLTAILSYVELMKRMGGLNDQQLEFADEVKASVKSITGLIEDILQLEKVESDLDTQREPIYVPTMIERVLEPLRGRADVKRQKLNLVIGDDLPPIFGNSVRLRQALSNLVENAIKYTPPDGDIEVSVLHQSEQLFISVTDTGIGIDPADQAHVFEKFYRVDSVASSYEGTGLGLNIVKSIVDAHEGRIWVESQPDVGSTFTIVLPAYSTSPA